MRKKVHKLIPISSRVRYIECNKKKKKKNNMKIDHFKFTVYDLFDNDEYENIYDDLYMDRYKDLVREKHLIRCSVMCLPEHVHQVWEEQLDLYEGMCYNVEAYVDYKYVHVIGGTFDPNDFEYILDFINQDKCTFDAKVDVTCNIKIPVSVRIDKDATPDELQAKVLKAVSEIDITKLGSLVDLKNSKVNAMEIRRRKD